MDLNILMISMMTRLPIDMNKTSLIGFFHFFRIPIILFITILYPNIISTIGTTITNRIVLIVTTFVENSTSPSP